MRRARRATAGSSRSSSPQARALALRIRPNAAQAVVTISVGIAFALATYLAGQASAHWNRAVKEDVKASAGLIEESRFLFADEGPFAYEYAVAVARADALAAAAAHAPRSEQGAALLEAHLTRTTVTDRRDTFLAGGETLLANEYWRGDHFDVASRLEDMRARSVVEADPRGAEATGDRYAAAAMSVAILPILIAGMYLAWWLWRRRRLAGNRQRVPAGDDVGLIPDPTDSTKGAMAALAFSAWLLLVLLPPLQIEQSLQGAQASSRSTTGAIAVMRTAIVSNLAASFEEQVQRKADALEKQAEVRAQLVASLPRAATAGQGAIVDAETDMVPSYHDIARATTTTLRNDTALDRATIDAVTADPDDWQSELAAQQAFTSRSESAGARDNAMTLGLVLAGIATTLAALATADRRSRAVPLMTAVALGGAAGSALLGTLL